MSMRDTFPEYMGWYVNGHNEFDSYDEKVTVNQPGEIYTGKTQSCQVSGRYFPHALIFSKS